MKERGWKRETRQTRWGGSQLKNIQDYCYPTLYYYYPIPKRKVFICILHRFKNTAAFGKFFPSTPTFQSRTHKTTLLPPQSPLKGENIIKQSFRSNRTITFSWLFLPSSILSNTFQPTSDLICGLMPLEDSQPIKQSDVYPVKLI